MNWLKKIKDLLGIGNRSIRYVCLSCNTKEDIPRDVVEYFDILDPGDNRIPPRFKCEKCGGEMWPPG